MELALLVIYFFYGLVFVVMGVVIAMEVGRFPALGEARVLRPLAAFGFSHGLHEWVELLFLLGYLGPQEITSPWAMGRLALLAFSFASLVAYGVQMLRPPRGLAATDALVGGGMLALYLGVVLFAGAVLLPDAAEMVVIADALSRYVLAVPGCWLAVYALRQQITQAQAARRVPLAHSLRWAVGGFVLYGFSQLFVPAAPFFPADSLNAATFMSWLGFPVQAVRMLAGLVVTLALMRAVQVVDKERQAQLAAAQRARLEALQQVQEELLKREALRKELLRRIVLAQEDERARIARELHDELAQVLTAFSLDVATLKNLLGEDDPECQSLLTRLQEHGRQMSRRLYRLVHDLRPAQLDDLGLIPAVRNLLNRARQNLGLQVALEVKGEPRRLDPLVETVCYRVVQEALTNVARHALTRAATVAFAFGEQDVKVSVKDVGAGFDPHRLEEGEVHFGIAGMRERVRSVGGDFELWSSPGEGTEIRVIIPYTREQTDGEFQPDSHPAGR